MGPREVAARTDYVRRSRTRTIQSLRRTAGMLERVIDQNRLLAENPDHRRSSLVRIAEGKVELDLVRAHLAVLEDEANLGS